MELPLLLGGDFRGRLGCLAGGEHSKKGHSSTEGWLSPSCTVWGLAALP